jgi:hypothetical protein
MNADAMHLNYSAKYNPAEAPTQCWDQIVGEIAMMESANFLSEATPIEHKKLHEMLGEPER